MGLVSSTEVERARGNSGRGSGGTGVCVVKFVFAVDFAASNESESGGTSWPPPVKKNSSLGGSSKAGGGSCSLTSSIFKKWILLSASGLTCNARSESHEVVLTALEWPERW